MPFKAGDPKPEHSGRKAGTPNKRTLSLVERLNDYGIEPIHELIALIPQLSPKEQADIYRDLLGYIYPKRKAVEMQIEEFHETESRPRSREEIRELILAARGTDNPLNERIVETIVDDYLEPSQGSISPIVRGDIDAPVE